MTIYFQDGGHDVISRRKVLPPGECTRSAWFIIYMRMTFKYYGVVFKVEGLRWLTRDFSQKTKITFVYYAVYVWIYASTSTQYSTVPLSFIHLNAVPYPREMLNPKCREWLTERVRRSIVCHDFNALRRTYTYAETDRQTDRQTDRLTRRRSRQIGVEAVTFVAVSKKHQRRIYFSAADASAAAAGAAAIRPFSRHAGITGRLTAAVVSAAAVNELLDRQSAGRASLTTLLVTVPRLSNRVTPATFSGHAHQNRTGGNRHATVT